MRAEKKGTVSSVGPLSASKRTQLGTMAGLPASAQITATSIAGVDTGSRCCLYLAVRAASLFLQQLSASGSEHKVGSHRCLELYLRFHNSSDVFFVSSIVVASSGSDSSLSRGIRDPQTKVLKNATTICVKLVRSVDERL